MSIVKFVDVLAKELLDQAKELPSAVSSIAGTKSTEIESQISPLTSQVATVV